MADFIASLMLLVGVPMLAGSVALWWRGVQAEKRALAPEQPEERITQKASSSDGSFCDGC